MGAGGAGKAGAGSRKVNPRCGEGKDDGAGWLGWGLGAAPVVAARTGAGGGKGTLANGGGGVSTGGVTGTDGNGGNGGTGCTAAGKGASTMLKGLPSPALSPGIPNCSDNSSACSSSDTSKPPASRRFDGARLAGTRGTVAGIAKGMDMLMAVGNIV